jgi:hypothetical protein
MKEEIAGKRRLLRTLRKALATINPKRGTLKKRSSQKKAAAATSTE